MTSIVTDFKSINRIVSRQEQKAEFEAKNPVPDTSMYGWPYGVAVPLTGSSSVYYYKPVAGVTIPLAPATSLKSLAHPEWPYTGTPHEWPKFKI